LAAGDALLAAGAPGRVARREDALTDAAGDVAAFAGSVAGLRAADAINAREAGLARSRSRPARFACLQEAALPGLLPAALGADAAAVFGTEFSFGCAVTGAAALRTRDIRLTDGACLARHVVAPEADRGLRVATNVGRAPVGTVGWLQRVVEAAKLDGSLAAYARALAFDASGAVAAAR
jgi:hypothetical protein